MARGAGEHGHETAGTARSAQPARGQEDAPGGPPSPQAVIIELTLNFFQAEIDQAALFCSDVVQNVQDLSQAKALNTTGEHV